MRDTPQTGTTAGKPQTARGRELDVPAWMTLPPADRYLAGARTARAAREDRAREAGRAAVELARDLAASSRDPGRVPEHVRWSVRGEPRPRERFGSPHPGDFPGAGRAPREYPA